jgi:hypothetical protein
MAAFTIGTLTLILLTALRPHTSELAASDFKTLCRFGVFDPGLHLPLAVGMGMRRAAGSGVVVEAASRRLDRSGAASAG